MELQQSSSHLKGDFDSERRTHIEWEKLSPEKVYKITQEVVIAGNKKKKVKLFLTQSEIDQLIKPI